jgi:hypothetical protein
VGAALAASSTLTSLDLGVCALDGAAAAESLCAAALGGELHDHDTEMSTYGNELRRFY